MAAAVAVMAAAETAIMDLAMTVRPERDFSDGQRPTRPAARRGRQPAPWPGPDSGRSPPPCRTRSPAPTRPPGRPSELSALLPLPQVTAAAAPAIPAATGATAAAAPTTAIITAGGALAVAAEDGVPPGDPRLPCGMAFLKRAQVRPLQPPKSPLGCGVPLASQLTPPPRFWAPR